MSYTPNAIFSVEDGENKNIPRALISPARYIQGAKVLEHLGRYLSIVPSKTPAILMSDRRQQTLGARLTTSLKQADVEPVIVPFFGESSLEEIDRIVTILKTGKNRCDSVIGVGAGKCIDTARCVAFRLDVPAVICPTLASSDAPCSAVAGIYSSDGVFSGVEFFPNSPALVVVDTAIIAAAPARYLAAGMGDAMATWYEARACFRNPKARTMLGARPTLAAATIGELCARTLFESGIAAMESVQHSEVSPSLESIVEANTLLSGIGFESGGLAAAHSVALGFTMLPKVHHHHLHGEMVAMGLLTQLMLESDTEEATKVAEFFATVGLPVHLGQISMSPKDTKEIEQLIETSMTIPFVGNEPFPVDKKMLADAFQKANTLGMQIATSVGDAAFRALQK